MEKIFLHLLNMSLTAAVLVLVVLWLRVIFRRAPRWIHCLLWALVAVRLLCPFTIESDLSLMPENIAVFAPESLVSDAPQVEVIHPGNSIPDTPVIDSPVTVPNGGSVGGVVSTPVATPTPESSLSAPTPEASADPWQIALAVATYVWLAGVVVLAAYAAVTTLRLRRKVGESAHLEGNLWHCDHIRSPFILGVFRPRIYLPSDLSGTARDSVIAHEQAHLHRRDHWWKPLGFLLLTVYWFNPLMWVAYVLLCRDIEAACDQRVVRDMSAADRKAYSEALLTCSAPRRLVSACPLAFGENSVKSRIKSVLSYKKPTVWIIVVALLVSTVAGVCLLTDPKSDTPVINPDTQPSDTDMDTDPTDGIRYADFIHNEEPKAVVRLEIGGNRCTYTNSIASSWVALGTYTMGDDSVTLNFPDEAMEIIFDGDLTGLKLRMGMGSTKMSYEQMSFGNHTLENGAVFARIADARRVSFAAPLTFSDMNWIEDERYTALCQHKYRNDHLSSEDLPILAIASRAELDAFIAEYTEDFSFNKAEGDGLTPTHQMSFYDDAFFAEKQLLAVYYRNGSCSMRPQISAVEYNGEELVTVSVDVYEPSMHQDALGQWFLLAEVPRAEIKDATAYRAVIRNRVPTDYYWATYSHPVTVGDTEPAVGKYRLEYDAPDTLRQLVERLDWYGADIMADTAFTAIGYFSFDGVKKYYLDPSLTVLYDGEQIADLTDEDAASLDYLLRSGVPTDAATTYVVGNMTEWNKQEGYMMLEVTEGDAKLGDRVKVFTCIMPPGGVPVMGASVKMYYDGYYVADNGYSIIYGLYRTTGGYSDELGGPDDVVTDPTTTGSTIVTTKPSTTKPSATESTSTTKPTTKPTTTAPTAPPIPTSAEVGDTLVLGGMGIWNDGILEEVYGDGLGEGWPLKEFPIKAFYSYAELEAFLNQYAEEDRYLKRSDFTKFTADWFTENALLMTYYVDGSCSVHPKIGSYTYSADGKTLTVSIDVYEPQMGNTALGGWHMFAGIKKANLENVVEITACERARIPEHYYIALFVEPTMNPKTAEEKWRKWLPDEEGWDLSRLVSQWNSAGLFVDVTRTCKYVAAFHSNGHVHYVSEDFAALQRDDGKLYWLTEYDANLIKRIIAISEGNNTDN